MIATTIPEKITVTANSMVKFLLSNRISSVSNAVNVMKHPGSTTDYMVDVIIMHVVTNDLTKGVNTMKNRPI